MSKKSKKRERKMTKILDRWLSDPPAHNPSWSILSEDSMVDFLELLDATDRPSEELLALARSNPPWGVTLDIPILTLEQAIVLGVVSYEQV